MNTQKLKGVLAEKACSQEDLARKIGVNRSTFYRKMQNEGAGFSVKDIQNMTVALQLSQQEVMGIFFENKVALMPLKNK